MGILALPSATMALSLFLLSTCSAAKATEATLAHDRPGESREQATDGAVLLSANSSIRDILNHQAFSGFSRRMLPWDDRSYDENMPLAEIGSLLPYHSLVHPETVVGSLNSMTDEVGKGRTVFYDSYTEAQKRADPTKEHAGLFFIRGKPGAPFAVIPPGGGFSYVGSVHEGFPYAVEIRSKGYNAFVLKYRVGQGGTVATQDLAAAISYIFENADTSGSEDDIGGSTPNAPRRNTIRGCPHGMGPKSRKCSSPGQPPQNMGLQEATENVTAIMTQIRHLATDKRPQSG